MKNKQPQKRLAVFLSILVMTAIVLACGGTSGAPADSANTEPTATRFIPTKTPYVTATIPSSDILTATASALQAHSGAVRFMSYSIQDGAPGEKLAIITSILQAYNADVLALQEINGWDANDFANIKQTAEALGMEYIYCKAEAGMKDANGNTYDVALLSKLEIKSSEIHTNVHNCLIRAEVATPNGQIVQVFATYIRPEFDKVGCKNIENLAAAIQPFAQEPVILMGDMTIPPPGIIMGFPENQIACPPLLEAIGLEFFAHVGQVDHIWITPALLAFESYKLPNPSAEPLVVKTTIRNASDHSPLAVDFYFP